MFKQFVRTTNLLLLVALVAACGKATPTDTPTQPTATPVPPTATLAAVVSTDTPEPVAAQSDAAAQPEVERPAWQWPTSSSEEQGMNPELLSALLERIEQATPAIHDIVIVRNGYLVLDEHYDNEYFARGKSRPVFSCAKSIVSILIGIAIDKGYIEGVDQTVLSFFPGRAVANLNAGKEAMTLEDLLTMSTGLDCQDSYLYDWVGLEEMRKSGNRSQDVLDLPMSHEPGAHFEYCNGASHLLSTIIQRATGMSTFIFAYEHLFRPLGITQVSWGISPEGTNAGFAEVFMPPHDLAKIGLLTLNQGRWNDEQIVSAEWVAESTREHISAGTLADGYGYQWWVDANGYYMAQGLTRGHNMPDGYGGQYLFVAPQQNMVVVFAGELYDDDFQIPEELLNEYIIPTADGAPTSMAMLPEVAPPIEQPTFQWQTSSPEEQGMNPELLSDMLEYIEQTGPEIHSITIIRNGYMVFDEHYYDSASVYPWRSGAHNEPHPICSCTKSMVATLIGIAIDKGYIEGVDQPLLSFFPERTVANVDARKEALTLGDLLTMSAGFRCGDDEDWRVLEQMIESGDPLQYMLDRPMLFQPGTHFEYCNGVSHLLSAILENATGMSTSVFAYEYLFRPLGITNLTWGVDYHGITLGYTDMYMPHHDMAKIGLLYLNQGRWDGEQIISAEWAAESTREQIFANRDSDGYGYQWWVDANGYYFAAGLGGQFIFVVPQYNMVVVFTSLLFDDDFLIPEKLLNRYIIPAAE
jgi:CubicO group peptidase (beta-lactamase class C family)